MLFSERGANQSEVKHKMGYVNQAIQYTQARLIISFPTPPSTKQITQPSLGRCRRRLGCHRPRDLLHLRPRHRALRFCLRLLRGRALRLRRDHCRLRDGLPSACLQPVHIELRVVERDVEEQRLLVRGAVNLAGRVPAVVREPVLLALQAVGVERRLELGQCAGGERVERYLGGGDGVFFGGGEEAERGLCFADVDGGVLDQRKRLRVLLGCDVCLREVFAPENNVSASLGVRVRLTNLRALEKDMRASTAVAKSGLSSTIDSVRICVKLWIMVSNSLTTAGNSLASTCCLDLGREDEAASGFSA